jgi:hypothetical protein
MYVTTETPSGTKRENLKDELSLNIDLWKHEENLRQQRNTVLLGSNALLAVAAGAVIGAELPLSTVLPVGLVLALFGIGICRLWSRIQRRHVEYADFRRKQIREIAKALDYSSMENHWRGLRTNPEAEPVPFPLTGETFEPDSSAQSAIAMESRLPAAVAGFWAVVILGGIIAALIA